MDDDELEDEHDDPYDSPGMPDPLNPFAPDDEDADGVADDEEDDY